MNLRHTAHMFEIFQRPRTNKDGGTLQGWVRLKFVMWMLLYTNRNMCLSKKNVPRFQIII